MTTVGYITFVLMSTVGYVTVQYPTRQPSTVQYSISGIEDSQFTLEYSTVQQYREVTIEYSIV